MPANWPMTAAFVNATKHTEQLSSVRLVVNGNVVRSLAVVMALIGAFA